MHIDPTKKLQVKNNKIPRYLIGFLVGCVGISLFWQSDVVAQQSNTNTNTNTEQKKDAVQGEVNTQPNTSPKRQRKKAKKKKNKEKNNKNTENKNTESNDEKNTNIGDDGQNRSNKLDKKALLQKLAEKRAAIKQIDAQTKSILNTLGELDETIDVLEEEQEDAADRVDELMEQVQALQPQVDTAKKELDEVRARLRIRMRELYVAGKAAPLRLLLGAESFDDVALRRMYAQQQAKADQVLLEEHRRAYSAVQNAQAKIALAADEARLLASTIRDQQELLEATRAERLAAIEKMRSEKELLDRSADELEAQKQALGSLISKFIEESGNIGGASLGRNNPWPVVGAVTRGFGVEKDPETHAESISNGIHISAPLGTPVNAIASGKVAYVGWMRGFGRVVIIDHGGSQHTILAHLGSAIVDIGEEVTRGQMVGTVGDTESTNGPELYFEFRLNSRPRNPMAILRR